MGGILGDLRLLEIGGRGAAVCGELFAQLGADVLVVRPLVASSIASEATAAEAIALTANKRFAVMDIREPAPAPAFEQLVANADFIVVDLPRAALDALDLTPERLIALNPRLVVATITPFGLSGPRRDYRGGDLISFNGSGVARLLVGHVDDPEREPPVRAAGGQSAFIAGLTAACAAMHALYQQQRTGTGQLIDVSAQEAMALMAARELAMPAFGGQPAARAGRERGGSAVIPILPALDGYVAISPREVHQWSSWLEILGNPRWGSDAKFATRAARTTNYPELFELMAEWSRSRHSQEIFEICQAAHVPCFPFGAPSDMLKEAQLLHRQFFVPHERAGGATVLVPRPPFGLPLSDYTVGSRPPFAGHEWLPRPVRPPPSPAENVTPWPLPLSGLRVLDFSWVIAGPTSTRYLALMGAEVIKIEAPDRPDTGRTSELHDVLGQSKLALSLDLRAEGALAAVRKLLENADVVVENFAGGVMERLGLGYDDLRKVRPDIILLSASGLGRTGPGSGWVAYGNLLSAYSGFAALNGPVQELEQSLRSAAGEPGEPPQAQSEPRTGLAWADPLCGLFMAFGVAAALRNRDWGGGGRHLDFSMLEGLLWTMPGALIGPQISGQEVTPEGNDHPTHVPHSIYRAAGEDRWLAIAVTGDSEWRALCSIVPDLADMAALSEEDRLERAHSIDSYLSEWARDHDAIEAMDQLQAAGVAASASYTTNDMFGDAHLWERGFYQPVAGAGPDETPRFLPGLPWRWGDGSLIEPRAAPAQGEHNEYILRDLAGLSDAEFTALMLVGAFGT